LGTWSEGDPVKRDGAVLEKILKVPDGTSPISMPMRRSESA